MGATRMVMAMAVLAIGAGAFLAVSTIPALEPYRIAKREGSAPLVAARDSEQDVRQLPEYGVPPPNGSSGQTPRPGMQDQSQVLELPRWVEDGGEWLVVGRRAWRDWVEPGDADAEPFDTGGPVRGHDYGYGYRDDDRRNYRQDYAPGYQPRGERHWRDEEDGAETPYGEQQQQWIQPLPPSAPALAQSGGYGEPPQTRRESGTMRQRAPAPAGDAADSAAERARQAAQDVRAAESLQ